MTIAKRVTSTATPRLRISEFQEAAGWKETTLSDICEMRAGKFVSGSDIADAPASGWFACYGGNGLRGYTRSFTHEGKHSLIGRQGALCGNVRRFDGKFHATEHALVVTPKNDVDTDWLFYALGLLELNKYSTGQAQPGLSVQVLEKVLIFAPRDSKEQQKIADCLTSLDEVIAAQGRKVEALKAHKRGLMQQLFPREGETRPRLRFPEFRNAPEWRLKRLDDFSPLIFDGTHQTPRYTVEGIPFYSVENLISGSANKFISREDYLLATKKNKPEKEDVLFTRIGKIGHSQVVTWSHEFSVYVTLAVIKASPQIDSYFLHYTIQSEMFQAEVRSKSLNNAVPPKINMDSLRSTQLLITDFPEQQRIANCLSSLDTQITAESNQVAALKTHKQGLMQQLFPTPEGIGA